MLYEGAIKYLHQAKDKIDEKDYAAKGILISKAIDVISELDESLNVQKGGQIAENLHGLYFYCNTRLLQANMDMDKQIVDEVLNVLENIKAAFLEISSQQSGLDASTAPGAGNTAQGAPSNKDRSNDPKQAGQTGPGTDNNANPSSPPARESGQSQSPEQPAGGKASVETPGKTLPGGYGRIGGYK
jgi:flagellar protein FliS